MARANINDQVKTDPLMVAYSADNTINEIIEGIKELRKNDHQVSENVSLRKAVDYVLRLYGTAFSNFENWEEAIRFLENQKSRDKAIDEIENELKKIGIKDQDNSELEIKMDSKSLRSDELEAMLREYNRCRDKRKAEEIAREMARSNNPLLKRFGVNDFLKVVREKVELENKFIREGINSVDADRLSDSIIITENKIEVVVAKEIKPGKVVNKETIGVLAEQIVIAAEKESETLASEGNEAKKVINTQVSNEAQAQLERLVKLSARKIEANNRLDAIVRVAVDKLTVENGLSREKILDIKVLVKEAVHDVSVNASRKINEPIISIKLNISGGLEASLVKVPVVVGITKTIGTTIRGPTTVKNNVPTVKGTSKYDDKTGRELASVGGGGTDAAGKEIAEKRGQILKRTFNLKEIHQQSEIGSKIGAQEEGMEESRVLIEKGFDDLLQTELADLPMTDEQKKSVAITIDEAGRKVEMLWQKHSEIMAAVIVGDFETSLYDAGLSVEEVNILRDLRFPGEAKGIEGNIKAAIEEYQAARSLDGQQFSETRKAQAPSEANVLKGLLRSPKTVQENVNKIIGLSEKLKGVKGAEPLLRVATTLNKNQKLMRGLEMVRGLVAWQDRFNTLTGGIFSNGTGWLVRQTGKMLGKVGGERLIELGAAMAARLGLQEITSNLAAFSLEKGISLILQKLFTTGIVTGVKAGTTAVITGAVEVGAGLATGPPGWVVTAVVMAIQFGYSLWQKLKKSREKILAPILSALGIETGKVERWLKNEFGGLIGGLLNAGISFGVKISGAMLALPTLIVIPSAALAIILVAVIVGIPLYGQLNTATVSTAPFAPPRGMGGGEGVCIPKEATTGPGTASCNASAADCTIPGLSKDVFVSLASRYSAGGELNAAKCFNDVVGRALAAGKNPLYALAIWLHESGASNSSLGAFDFGVIYATKNFGDQIDAFLKLDPSPLCLGKDGIGDDYWLAFSANFSNGRDSSGNPICDPNFETAGVTANTYKDDFLGTFDMMGVAVPDSISGSGGASCGGGAGSGGVSETDANGNEFVCYGGGHVVAGTGGYKGNPVSDIPLPTLNPNVKIPIGCPMGWPVDKKFTITQGPHAQGCSHSGMEAIDFGSNWATGASIVGANIYSTINGLARAGSNSVYGNYVDVTGTCEGKTVTTRYAHMPSIPFSGVKEVKQGDVIGQVDNTGSSTGDHLHYDWRYLTDGALSYSMSDSLGNLSHSLEGCCNGDNGIMCQ